MLRPVTALSDEERQIQEQALAYAKAPGAGKTAASIELMDKLATQMIRIEKTSKVA